MQTGSLSTVTGGFYVGVKMEVMNYIKLRSWRPFTCQYMFLDTEEYLADGLFVKYKVPVRFEGEYVNKKSQYRVITCRIRKRYEKQFREALTALPDKMLLMGHTDYADSCRELFDSFQEAAV